VMPQYARLARIADHEITPAPATPSKVPGTKLREPRNSVRLGGGAAGSCPRHILSGPQKAHRRRFKRDGSLVSRRCHRLDHQYRRTTSRAFIDACNGLDLSGISSTRAADLDRRPAPYKLRAGTDAEWLCAQSAELRRTLKVLRFPRVSA
jgi:hypothetical protein